MRGLRTAMESVPRSQQLERAGTQQRRPNAAKKKKMSKSYPNRPEAAFPNKFLQDPLSQKRGVLPLNSRNALVVALVWSLAPPVLCLW